MLLRCVFAQPYPYEKFRMYAIPSRMGGEVRDLQFTRDTGSDDFEQSYKWSLAAMRVPKVKEMTELQVGFFTNQFLSKTTPSQIRLYLDRHWARGD